MTETTSNKMSPREELTRFLFQSDKAEGRLGILTVAFHQHGNGYIYNQRHRPGPFCERYVHSKYTTSCSYPAHYF